MTTFKEIHAIIKELHVKCPWDREQTLETLKEILQEEGQEVKEGIEKKDYENVKEELGDVLWDVLLMVEVAEKQKLFTFEDVLTRLKTKMVGRHPHVYGDKIAKTAEDAIKHFNDAKKKEKAGLHHR